MSGEGGGVISDCRGHSASTKDSRFGNARPNLHTSIHVDTGFPIKKYTKSRCSVDIKKYFIDITKINCDLWAYR